MAISTHRFRRDKITYKDQTRERVGIATAGSGEAQKHCYASESINSAQVAPLPESEHTASGKHSTLKKKNVVAPLGPINGDKPDDTGGPLRRECAEH